MIDWKGFTVLAWLIIAAMALAGVAMFFIDSSSGGTASASGSATSSTQWLYALGWAAGGALLLWMIHRLPGLVKFFAAVAVAANMAGWIWNLFQQYFWYDEVVHGFTIFALTLAFGVLIYLPMMGGFTRLPGRFMLSILTLGLAIGAVWEMVEYTAMVFTNFQMKGLTDTVTDLMFDGLGALLAALMAPWVAKATDQWAHREGIETHDPGWRDSHIRPAA